MSDPNNSQKNNSEKKGSTQPISYSESSSGISSTPGFDENFEVVKEGVRFECQGSGKCCSSRGQYGFVYLNKLDRARMAEELGLSQAAFTKKFCQKTDGYYHLKSDSEQDDCQFLKDKKCTIYEGRPTQCRTWPFWPEVMNAKSWSIEVAGFCPGIGKGRFFSPTEIKDIMNGQIRSEEPEAQ